MPLLPHETTDIDYLKEVVAQTLEQRESVFASVWLQLLSKLYLHQCTISSRKSFGSIDELIMDGVDHETIWEQLQSRNKPLIRFLKARIVKLSQNWTDRNENSAEHVDVQSDDDVSTNGYQNSKSDSDLDGGDSSFSADDAHDAFYKTHEVVSHHGDSEDEMEAWLDLLDNRHDRQRQKISDGHKSVNEEYSSEEDDDVFVDRELYKDVHEENDEIMYSDFFVNDRRQQTESIVDTNDPKSPIHNSHKSNQNDSHYEHKKQKLSKEIESIEKMLVAKKEWEMRGEVKSADRPENSLLSVSADFERAAKPAPVVTLDFTKSLEGLVIERIKLQQFDNVTVKSVATLRVEEGERTAVDEEKGRQGLGEVYANEFLAKTLNAEESLANRGHQNLVTDVKDLFDIICRELDGLSHFHFCPKPVVAEASLSSLKALPSISLEDITPISASIPFTDTVAPEQIFAKKRGRDASLMADTELTREDRKRLRASRKSTRRTQRKADGILQRRDPIQSDHRVVEGTVSARGASSKNSGDFFSNLQQKVGEEINTQNRTNKLDHISDSRLTNFKL